MTSPRTYGEVRYEREAGQGFDRVVFFIDAVYAIAMTLIVVSLDVPDLGRDQDSAAALRDALDAMSAEIVTFFITFLVIGQFWLANHRFTESLRAMDTRLILIGLAYLSLVAFLPFPSSLMGDYDGNPLAVATFATAMALISLLEWVQLLYARTAGLLVVRPSSEEFRWLTVASLNPVLWFGASVGIAFALGPTAAMLSWLAALPTGWVIDRLRPGDPEPA